MTTRALSGDAGRSSALWNRLGPDPARVILGLEPADEEIARRHAAVRTGLLEISPHLRTPGLEKLEAGDLESLVRLYDEHCFAGWLGELLREATPAPLELRLSRRMTSVGGATRKRCHRARQGGRRVEYDSYEIAVSSVLLFQSFADVDRPIVVSGIECADRLAALQRIVEHELVHLIEFLVWGRSSCARKQFQRIARNVFGHTAASHQLVTQRERALVRHGVRVGDWVEFDADGARHAGFIRRITRRATVLVEDRAGLPYSDGRRYTKWLVPLAELRRTHSRR